MNNEPAKTGDSMGPKPTFGPEIDLFTRHIDAIGDALLAMIFAVHMVATKHQEDLHKFEEENCEVEKNGDERIVKVSNVHFRNWKTKMRKFDQFAVAGLLLPRSLLVSMISQYDAFLGRLLRTVFLRKPEILNASDKKISFEILSQFSTIDSAREYILEKEVESVLRSSHVDQFRWMEKAFGLTLTKDLKSWPVFIEITERRNLFVHTDGIVSSQYLAVCGLHKCTIDEDVKEGSRLEVPQKYFETAHECIVEIGVKLGHVLWRKLFPDEREAADSNLVRITYDLIDNKKYNLAIRLLDFATTELKRYSSEVRELTFIVNRAQAYKWTGDDERCAKIMRAVDWSAKGDEFRLADAVLAEDWPRAARIMKRIGNSGPIEQTQYRDWPLFRDWRKQTVFLSTYREIYGEDFATKSEIKKELVPPIPESHLPLPHGPASNDI